MAYQEGERARKLENPTTRGRIENTSVAPQQLALEKLGPNSPVSEYNVTLLPKDNCGVSASRG